VVIKDHETGQLIKEIPFRPEWQVHTYNFFQKKPEHLSYRPKFEVESFLNLLKNSTTETAASYIHFERSDQFPWKNLSHDYLQSVRLQSEFYVGSYLGYEDVFAINLLYFDPDKQRRTTGEEFAKQTVYFIVVKNALVVRKLPEIYQKLRIELCYREPEGYREYAKILLLNMEFNFEDVLLAIKESLKSGHVGFEYIRQLLISKGLKSKAHSGPTPGSLPELDIPVDDPSKFNYLIGGVSA